MNGLDRYGRSDGRDLQPDGRARILRHLHRILLAIELVNHVISGSTVLVKSLCRAILHVLRLGLPTAFDPVTQHGAAQDAQKRRDGAAIATADVAANSAARHRTQDATRAGFL